MPVIIRGKTDEALLTIRQVLLEFEARYPPVDAVVYRRNSISIRIRVCSQVFSGLEMSDRHNLVWSYLDKLPEEIRSDISMVVLLAPGEEAQSLANLEFEDPSPTLIK